jgi:hypothetical protein
MQLNRFLFTCVFVEKNMKIKKSRSRDNGKYAIWCNETIQEQQVCAHKKVWIRHRGRVLAPPQHTHLGFSAFDVFVSIELGNQHLKHPNGIPRGARLLPHPRCEDMHGAVFDPQQAYPDDSPFHT